MMEGSPFDSRFAGLRPANRSLKAFAMSEPFGSCFPGLRPVNHQSLKGRGDTVRTTWSCAPE
jgi:hypothetical protein